MAYKLRKKEISLYLNPAQVTALILQAEQEDEVVVIRCKRKTPASKPGGTDQGQLYDLHCGARPKRYKRTGLGRRRAEDKKNGILTVYVTNRRDPDTGFPGAWRRVNLAEVVKVIYKTHEWEVVSK